MQEMKKYDIVYYPNFKEILYKIVATKQESLINFGPYNKTIKPIDNNDCVIMKVTNIIVKNGEKIYESKGELKQEKFENLRKLEL